MRRHKVTKPGRARSWRGNALAVGGALLAGAAFLTVQDLSNDLRDANEARDQLAVQVQRLGAKPVAGPPGSRGQPGEGIVGPVGPRGETGPVGPEGPVGPSGKPGGNGANGSDGADGVGEPGAPGENGASVVGPAGPQGEPGPAGQPGERGSDGADGRDGQTCPTGYSLQPPPGDPDGLMCRRDTTPAPDSEDDPQSLALDPYRRQYP